MNDVDGLMQPLHQLHLLCHWRPGLMQPLMQPLLRGPLPGAEDLQAWAVPRVLPRAVPWAEELYPGCEG